MSDNALPLVAVVTPVYNGAATLAETMESVQSQTYSNIVHVVLNNNSTDETAYILKAYENKAKAVQIKSNDTTLPQMENWNRALEHVPSEARYVTILCADDLMRPLFVEKLTAVAETHPEAAIVGCNFSYHGMAYADGWSEKPVHVSSGPNAIRDIFLGPAFIMPTHLLWRRQMMTRRPFFASDLFLSSDLDASLFMLTQGGYAHLAEELAWTRVHHDSMTSRHDGHALWYLDAWRFYAEYRELAFPSSHERVLTDFQRHFIQRLIAWRFSGKLTPKIAENVQRSMALAGRKLDAASVIDAALHFGLRKLGFGETWKGWPPWH